MEFIGFQLKMKEKEEATFEAKVKNAIRKLETQPSLSISAASSNAKLCNKTLKRQYQQYLNSGLSLRDWSVEIKQGRPKLLDSDQIRTLTLYLHALDQFGIPATQQTLRETIRKLRNDPLLPSKTSVYSLIKDLGLPLKKAKNGLSVRDTKSCDVDTVSDFYSTLKSLYDEYNFLPECIFNTDEVGIQLASRPFEFFSTRNVVRKNLVGEGHLTVSITSSAAGGVLKPFFIFPGQDVTAIPAGSLENGSYVAYSPSAYMDEVLFQQWLLRFIEDTKEIRIRGDVINPILLILDGHSSHINLGTLFTAACHQIVVLCLPSHTTHLLQPNDFALNKTVKDNMQKNLSQLLEANEEITCGELASIVSKALQCENISLSVKKSFEHTGIFPFDPLKMSVLMKKASVKDMNKEDEKFSESSRNLQRIMLLSLKTLYQRSESMMTQPQLFGAAASPLKGLEF